MTTLFKGKLINPKANDYLRKIIEPVLCHLSDVPFSQSASQLLLATAIKESQNFKYRQQIGGPALSYFQIEPNTHNDVWDNYLKFRPKLAKLVTQLLSAPDADKIDELENNDNYAAAIARIVYKRSPAKLPPADDISAMANYWKQHYNTPLGKGTPKGFIDIWNKSTTNMNIIYKKKCVVL